MENEEKQQTKRCPQCGEEILKVAKRCKYCGAKIKKSSTKQLLQIVITGFIFIIVVAVVSNMGVDNRTNNAIDIKQLKNTAELFEYDDLARFPEKYQGKYLFFTGEVIQKTDDVLRVNVTKGEYDFWEDTVYVVLRNENTHILEDDIVKMWGISDGDISYTTIFGQKITIPEIKVYATEVIKKDEE